MKAATLAAGVLACLLTAIAAPAVEATAAWIAPIGSSWGEARITAGASTRLSIAAINLRAQTVYPISVRRGACSTVGSVVLFRRMTTSSHGTISTSVAFAMSEARLARLPMAIRVGAWCGSFKVVVPGTFGDGTWRVGTMVKPGAYRATGGPACHWARLTGFGAIPGDVIADNYRSDPYVTGPQIVRIATTDTRFASSGCGRWRLQSEPPVAVPTTAPGDGTWRVGIDILPGTYRAPGSLPVGPPYNWDNWTKGCRWARLSGFGGTDGEVVGVARFSTGPQIVTIAGADAGFASSGCGVWLPQSEPPVPVPTAAPGDGTWRVGIDILPGTYHATGGPVCRWNRLSGFGGTSGEIIAGRAAGVPQAGGQVVTISAADAGFASQDCGAWALGP